MKSIKIRLNKKFYDQTSIEEALDDFREICEGKIMDETFQVELKIIVNASDIEHEFTNYVLGLMKNKSII